MIYTVYKYKMPSLGRLITLDMPLGYRPLKIHIQKFWDDEGIYLWAEVPRDESIKKQRVSFCTIGTGHDIPDGYLYVGTAFEESTAYVWHVYEKWEV